MKVNNFDVLKEMCNRNSQSFHLYTGDNVQQVLTGSKGWGSVKIAISFEDACKIALNEKVAVCLLIWNTGEFNKIRAEMEGKNDPPEMAV